MLPSKQLSPHLSISCIHSDYYWRVIGGVHWAMIWLALRFEQSDDRLREPGSVRIHRPSLQEATLFSIPSNSNRLWSRLKTYHRYIWGRRAAECFRCGSERASAPVRNRWYVYGSDE